MLNSKILYSGGPGRQLCTPTHVATSDGPWRTLKFKVKFVRHDYQNVLVSGDVKKLTNTAEELLVNPHLRKKSAFWEIFSKRVKASAHLLTPLDMSIILRSFDVHRKDTGIYVATSTAFIQRKGIQTQLDGFSLVTLIDIFSRKLKKNSNDFLFQILSNKIPFYMYELSVEDLVGILSNLSIAAIKNRHVCRRICGKILGNIGTINAHLLSKISINFAMHDFRDIVAFKRLSERAKEVHSDLKALDMYNLLLGFYKLSIDCSELLEGVSDRLILLLPNYKVKQLEFLKNLISDSVGNLDILEQEIDCILLKQH